MSHATTPPLTYCNPLPLPHYPRGRACRDPRPTSDDRRGGRLAFQEGWMHASARDFREMADPTVIRFGDQWYLFPSCGMLWSSTDLVQWTHQPIEPFDIGYAPTVVQCGEWLYLTASGSGLWRAKHPCGPWEELGPVRRAEGNAVTWWDPMLFVDDDGALYAYYGSGPEGISVVRLQRDDPTRCDGTSLPCVAFNPAHTWERFGEYNQDPSRSYVEGAWMTKYRGRYYLQYSAPGTEWSCYGIGCYVSDRPLGPFVYQARNPILLKRHGLITGCGHHSLVEGPQGHLWCFYTILVRIEHKFERRIGMDPAGVDAQGHLVIAGPTETPQLAPGLSQHPMQANDAGWLPLSVNQLVTASSEAPGHEAVYAVDDHIRTWWEAAGQAPQWLLVDLSRPFNLCAARTMFADRGLDYAAGIVPGPYHYRIDGSLDGRQWRLLLDRSTNAIEQHIAYEAWPAHSARYVRLTVLGAPAGMRIGIWEFTVFGRAT